MSANTVDIELDVPDDLLARIQVKAALKGLSVSDYFLRLMAEDAENPFPYPPGRSPVEGEGAGEQR